MTDGKKGTQNKGGQKGGPSDGLKPNRNGKVQEAYVPPPTGSRDPKKQPDKGGESPKQNSSNDRKQKK